MIKRLFSQKFMGLQLQQILKNNFTVQGYLGTKKLRTAGDVELKFKKNEFPYLQKDIKNLKHKTQLVIHDNYKYGFEKQDFEGYDESIKNIFKLENANPSEIRKFKVQKSIEKFRQSEVDHGSGVCQIVALTEKMYSMIQHCENNRKDIVCAEALSKLIDRRRRILHHMRLNDYHTYMRVIQEYQIPNNPPKYHHHKQNLRGPVQIMSKQATGHTYRWSLLYLKKSKRQFKK